MKLREDRWWNFIAVFCLLAAFMVTSFRLESTHWTEGLFVLKWLTLIGFILGLGFGYSYFSPLKNRMMIFLYSIIIMPWSIAFLYEDGVPWLERISSIVNRTGITLGYLFNNEPIKDPILFISFLIIVVWITAFLGGFSMTRSGKPWTALILSAITIIASEFYYNQNKDLYSFFFTIFALFVISLVNFMNSSKKWQSVGTLVEFETELNIGKTAIIASFILVFLAWNISGIVAAFQTGDIQQQQLVGFFENVRKQLTKITAPLQGPLLIHTEFYGDSIGLGTGAILGDSLVFQIDVDQSRPQGTRYYWRARTYDTYENNLWKSTITNEIPLSAESEAISYGDISRFSKRIFKFKTEVNLGLLYTPIYPTNISREATAIASSNPLNTIDLSALTLEPSIFAGESYSITANISTPSIMDMKEASTNYPEWILDNYLQLPDDFSSRITELAMQITENEETTYEKVQAVTFFLRNNIVYKEQIPLAPEDADPIEWFLFDLKEGFCNYYATAEVLMLRSIGIPARIVYGYAQGIGDEEGKSFRVLRKQSHAWVEVFFPGLGWVEFEPTSAQPVISRLTGQSRQFPGDLSGDDFDLESLDIPLSEELLDNVEEIDVPEATGTKFSLIALIPYLWIIFLVDIVLLYLVRRKRIGISFSPPIMLESFLEKRGWKIPWWIKRWSYYLRLAPAEKAFSIIAFSNYLLGDKTTQGVTPAELVGIFSKLLPEEKENAQKMLTEYETILFSRYPGDLMLLIEKSKHIFKKTILRRFQLFFSRKIEDQYS